MFTKIAIVGTGNIGTWLLKTLENQNNSSVISISSRKMEKLPQDFDLYIFALKDDVYETVLQQVPFKMPQAVHTSGSLSQNILAPFAEKFGVLYPYQTVTNYELRIKNYDVPVCVEASDPTFENTLFQWANSIFKTVHKINENQRFAMHLAAVFANNFTNAMYEVAHQIFKENNLEWSLIFPLLENTLEKAKYNAPHLSQTGPAVRHDISIMEKHGNALADEELQTLYRLISKLIQRQSAI